MCALGRHKFGSPLFLGLHVCFVVDSGNLARQNERRVSQHRDCSWQRFVEQLRPRCRCRQSSSKSQVSVADSTGRCNTLNSASAEGVLPVKQRRRIYYTAPQRCCVLRHYCGIAARFFRNLLAIIFIVVCANHTWASGNTLRVPPFALRYRRAFPGFDTLARTDWSEPNRIGVDGRFHL